MKYLLNRLREPSTWSGLGVVVGAICYFAKLPADASVAAAGMVSGLGAILADKPKQ